MEDIITFDDTFKNGINATTELLNNGNGQTLTFLGLLLSLRCSRGRFTLCRCGSCIPCRVIFCLFWGAFLFLGIFLFGRTRDGCFFGWEE